MEPDAQACFAEITDPGLDPVIVNGSAICSPGRGNVA
jgi:hypothetical protein